MFFDRRFWVDVAAGLLLARVCAAESHDAEAATFPVALVAGVVGVVLVTSLLALCAGHSSSLPKTKPAPPAQEHPPVRAQFAAPSQPPTQPSHGPPGHAHAGHGIPARKPLHLMSENSVQIDFNKAAHQQGRPPYVPTGQAAPTNGDPRYIYPGPPVVPAPAYPAGHHPGAVGRPHVCPPPGPNFGHGAPPPRPYNPHHLPAEYGGPHYDRPSGGAPGAGAGLHPGGDHPPHRPVYQPPAAFPNQRAASQTSSGSGGFGSARVQHGSGHGPSPSFGRSDGHSSVAQDNRHSNPAVDVSSNAVMYLGATPQSGGQQRVGAPGAPPQAAGHVLAPRDGSLDALLDFVRELVSQTGGRFGSGPYTIDGDLPIRKCLYTVHCQCKTTFGKAVDALFFASKTDWERQHQLLSKRPLQEYRADVREVMEETSYFDHASNLTIRAPNLIITEATNSMDDLINAMPTVQRNITISAIANQITGQLVMLHMRKILQCSITRSNIIQLAGMNPIWTFREYCSYMGEGKEMDVMGHYPDVRRMPPEAGEGLRKGQPVKASSAMDIWQLGVLLFELYAGSSYWPSEMSDADVLNSLAEFGGMPHERDPAKLNAIGRGVTTLQAQKTLIARMLERDPARRPTAVTLKRDLLASVSDLTMQGNTMTAWQPPVINIGGS